MSFGRLKIQLFVVYGICCSEGLWFRAHRFQRLGFIGFRAYD